MDISEEFLVAVRGVFFDWDDLWLTCDCIASVDEATDDATTMSFIPEEELILRQDLQVIRSSLGMIRRILMKFDR